MSEIDNAAALEALAKFKADLVDIGFDADDPISGTDLVSLICEHWDAFKGAVDVLTPPEGTTRFVMDLEPHEPSGPGSMLAGCECVLSSGPMCMDRSYCKKPETGMTWRKHLPAEDPDGG